VTATQFKLLLPLIIFALCAVFVYFDPEQQWKYGVDGGFSLISSLDISLRSRMSPLRKVWYYN